MGTRKLCLTEGCPNLSRTIKPGLCMACYQAGRRRRPVCKSEDCKIHLWPNNSKLGYCRLHEQEIFDAWDTDMNRAAWVKFEGQVQRDPVTGCWECDEAYLLPSEDSDQWYGRISLMGNWWLIHRFAYVWTYGGHKNGLQLDHRCTNSKCANPMHLLPTTGTRNIAFRDQRARDPQKDWDEWAPIDLAGELIEPVINQRLMLAMFWTGLSPSREPNGSSGN